MAINEQSEDELLDQLREQAREYTATQVVPKALAFNLVDPGRFPPGELLSGRFRIDRWIASGGMGEVYEARDLELDEQVAVKMIRRDVAAGQQATNRFRREISLARMVTHPNVCRIFDFFYHSPAALKLASEKRPAEAFAGDRAVAFLTMELLSGQTLSDHLRDAAPISTEEALQLVRQMVSALAAAHDAGVVHRDFKSSNVILVDRPRGLRAVVTDFGLAHCARCEGRGSEVTSPGEIIGSPAYMAPEQVLGDEITPATDIYALGIVMFHMITGRLPFETPSPMDTLAKRLKEEPPTPSQYVVGLDPRWDRAISRCLEREPEKRFASILDVLTALESK